MTTCTLPEPHSHPRCQRFAVHLTSCIGCHTLAASLRKIPCSIGAGHSEARAPLQPLAPVRAGRQCGR